MIEEEAMPLTHRSEIRSKPFWNKIAFGFLIILPSNHFALKKEM